MLIGSLQKGGRVLAVDTQYAYAVGKIRALEKRLLDRARMERMIDARSPEEALKVLFEAGYESGSDDYADVYEYENLLKNEQVKVYKLLKSIAPEPEAFDIFLFQNDYHNIKVLLKAEFLGQNNDYMLIDTGTVPVAELKKIIAERNLTQMPDTMQNAVEECIDVFNRTNDPQAIDIILDRATFQQMQEYAAKSGYKFVSGLVQLITDLTNIKIFLRGRSTGKKWDTLQKILLPGGSIDKKVFIEHLDDTLESFVNSIKSKPYGSICEEGIENFNNTGSLSKLERLTDNYIMSYIKKAKYVALGIEPLIAYLWAKENEIKNARIIMVGKINNISSEVIRERLRETYV